MLTRKGLLWLFAGFLGCNVSHMLESLINAKILFSGGAEELDSAHFVAPGCDLFVGHLPLHLPITLVRNDNEWEVVRIPEGGVLDELGSPILNVLKRLKKLNSFVHQEKIFQRKYSINRLSRLSRSKN